MIALIKNLLRLWANKCLYIMDYWWLVIVKKMRVLLIVVCIVVVLIFAHILIDEVRKKSDFSHTRDFGKEIIKYDEMPIYEEDRKKISTLIAKKSSTALSIEEKLELADLFYLGNELSQAESLYLSIVDDYPDTDQAYLSLIGLGFIAEEQGSYSEAERYFQRAREVNPRRKNAYSHIIRMKANYFLDYTGAMQIAKQALAEFPDDTTFLHLLAVNAEKSGDSFLARFTYLKIISINDADPQARRALDRLDASIFSE